MVRGTVVIPVPGDWYVNGAVPQLTETAGTGCQYWAISKAGRVKNERQRATVVDRHSLDSSVLREREREKEIER